MNVEGEVKLDIQNGVATVTFGHPKSNALPSSVLKNLKNTIEKLSGHSDVKVILLKSFGDRTFCAGASFDELMAINDFEKGKEFFMGFATETLTPMFSLGQYLSFFVSMLLPFGFVFELPLFVFPPPFE